MLLSYRGVSKKYENMEENPFSVDEIHAVRLQIAEESKKMTSEEAYHVFIMEVTTVQQKIDEIRKKTIYVKG